MQSKVDHRKRAPGLSDIEKTIVRQMAKNGLNVTDVSRAMLYHRNTIVYHIEMIKKATGKDPRNFCDLVELLKEVGE